MIDEYSLDNEVFSIFRDTIGININIIKHIINGRDFNSSFNSINELEIKQYCDKRGLDYKINYNLLATPCVSFSVNYKKILQLLCDCQEIYDIKHVAKNIIDNMRNSNIADLYQNLKLMGEILHEPLTSIEKYEQENSINILQ